MRFNPPPNWPPPPPGWTPDPSWAPDPSWPPPPPDWPLWIEQPKSNRKALWIAVAVVAVLLAVAGTVFAVGFHSGKSGVSASNPAGKPDIEQLTRDLLVDKSAFPDFDGGLRRSGLGNSDPKASGVPGLNVSPEECKDLIGAAKTATQSAYASVSKLEAGKLRSMEVRLSISPDRRDLKEQVSKCQKFTVSLDMAGRGLSLEGTLESLDAPGAPDWSVATLMASSGSPLPGIPLKMAMTFATISGYCRGVLVVASYNEVNPRGKGKGDKGGAAIDSESVDDLVKLFNAQVQNLQNAP